MMNSCELKRIPNPGQFLMYVELSDLKHCTLDEAIKRLEQLNYQPQLRYLTTKTEPIICALLRDEQHDSRIANDYRIDEVMRLYSAFPDDETAIHVASGSLQRVATAA